MDSEKRVGWVSGPRIVGCGQVTGYGLRVRFRTRKRKRKRDSKWAKVTHARLSENNVWSTGLRVTGEVSYERKRD